MPIKDWPADKVDRRAIADLVPYARNARTHSDAQVAQIAASMQEWGWTNPILVDETGMIIAGHGRVLAARKLGFTDAPVMVATGWTEAQKRAYVIADNKLALNAGWDMPALSAELGELAGLDFDLALTGFDDTELAGLLDKTSGLTDPDEVPPAPVNPVTRMGDLWICGNHRILCGDSTVETDVSHLLGSVKPHLMVTDPPYGVEYDANWRNEADRANGKPYGARAIGKVQNDGRADWMGAWALFPGDVAYVWCAPGPLQCVVHDSLVAAHIEPKQQIIWAKNQFAIGRGAYHYQHEVCWYAVKEKKVSHYVGDRKQSTIWNIDKPRKSETGHSTQKPVECMRRPIVNNSSLGQAVYEPFCGSGTTMIAAEMEGRHAYCIERSEAYCDVIVKRWQAFTGEQATLEGDGRTFEQLSDNRYDAKKDSAESYEVAIEAIRDEKQGRTATA